MSRSFYTVHCLISSAAVDSPAPHLEVALKPHPGAGPQHVVHGAVQVVRRLPPTRQGEAQPRLVVDGGAL